MGMRKTAVNVVAVTGRPLSAAELTALFRRLTGRDPEPEDVAQLKAELASDAARVARAKGGA